MRSKIFTLILVLGLAVSAAGQTVDTLTVRSGKQAATKYSKLKVKFAAVLEDSRCPAGVNCVWAGNAKIMVEVSNRSGGTKTLEMNTNMGPKGDQFDGWAIELVSLTPAPRANAKRDPRRYIATFTVTRLQR